MSPECPYNYDCDSTDNCMNECMGYSIEDEEKMTLSDIIYDIEEVLNHERSWCQRKNKIFAWAVNILNILGNFSKTLYRF